MSLRRHALGAALMLSELTLPALKKLLRAANVDPGDILACNNKQELLDLAARFDIVEVPDEWALAKLHEARLAEAQEKTRKMTTLAGLLEEDGGQRTITTPPVSKRGGGPSGARLRHNLRSARAAASTSSVPRHRPPVSGRSPPELKDHATKPRATRPPVTSRSMQAMINSAQHEMEERERAEAKKRRSARARARRTALEAEDAPLPTRHPDYPDWKVAPPHVLARNEEIREENRMAIEKAEQKRERQIEKLRKGHIKAAARASPDGSATVIAMYDYDPDESADGSDAGSWSGGGYYGGSNAGGAALLGFEAGELLTVFVDNGWGTVPKGWMLARNDLGHEGLVPETFFEVNQPQEEEMAAVWTQRLRPKSVRAQGPGAAVTRTRYQATKAAEERRKQEESEAAQKTGNSSGGVWGWLW